MANSPLVGSPGRHSTRTGGGLVRGGILLTLCGVMWVLEGVVALRKDRVFNEISDYTFQFDLTGWGWTHIVLGALSVITGIVLLATRAGWVRIAGIVLASLCICVNFVFVVYQPVWSLVMIAFAFFVVWSLASYNPYAEYADDDSGG